MIILKQSTASQEVPLGYFVDSTDGNTEETALTIANTDIKVWKTGATTLASKNSGGATHISNGIYYAVLDATDTDTLGPMVIFVHMTGALTVRLECLVVTAAAYDVLTAVTGDAYARLGAPAGASISADVAGVQSDTNDIQTRIPAALVAGRIDASVGAMATNVMTAAAAAADLTTELQAGLSTLDAAGIRAAVGLATANLDTQLTAIDDYLDTEVAAIKAKTDNLPIDPADASDIAGSFSTVNTTLSMIAGYLDTEIAAIKAKTDNLPAAPAAVGDIPTVATILTTAMTEAYPSDGGTMTLAQALYLLRAHLGDFSISGTTLTLKKVDGSTTAATFTLNDATSPTSITRAT